MNKIYLLVLVAIPLFTSCRGDDEAVIPSTPTPVQPGEKTDSIIGFYLLNEGNMGSNKCTLDFMDYATGVYHKNIYSEANPSVPLELGDVGNDLQIYGSKLYAVINCSNFVEVMDARTSRHLGIIEIKNCRYITFANGKAYVSSYAGPVQIDPNSRPGFVAEIDTTTLQVTREVTVGYQPEELVVQNNKLYVANSGGYRPANYDRTVSVIDLSSFALLKNIDVEINLHRMKADNYGHIYVTSRGNYGNVHSNIFLIDTKSDQVIKDFGIGASELCAVGDSIYLYSTEWSSVTFENVMSYGIINTKSQEIVTRNFITDGTEKNITLPYGLAVNPQTKEILIADAKDYVSPGMLHCYTADGIHKWAVTTGDTPAHFTFLHN